MLIDNAKTALSPGDFELFMDVLNNPPPPSKELIELMRRAAPWPELPHPDLHAATVSCSGTEITIQCNDHDVKDRLMAFLTGEKP
jgi:hypothetical protein